MTNKYDKDGAGDRIEFNSSDYERLEKLAIESTPSNSSRSFNLARHVAKDLPNTGYNPHVRKAALNPDFSHFADHSPSAILERMRRREVYGGMTQTHNPDVKLDD